MYAEEEEQEKLGARKKRDGQGEGQGDQYSDRRRFHNLVNVKITGLNVTELFYFSEHLVH